METQTSSLLNGRPVYHATPLHYLPAILHSGALLAQTIIGYDMARRTARRRDRVLAVDQYVHLSIELLTPLLKHKLGKGYPHAVLKFRTTDSEFPPIEILPCNTKSWRSKWQCQPVSEKLDIARLLSKHVETKRYSGLEVLVKERLSLSLLDSILLPTECEVEIVNRLTHRIDALKSVSVRLIGPLGVEKYTATNLSQVVAYYDLCASLKQCLPVPNLPFD